MDFPSASLLPAFERLPYNTRSRPVLYLVGMPLGDPEGISLRAISILKKADLLICESRKTAARYYKAWGLDFPRERHIEWNEHNDPKEAGQVCDLVLRTETSVLISDAGMPVLADPGSRLIQAARELGIEVRSVAGPTALTTALALAGLGNRGFVFAGFPPQKTRERRAWISGLLASVHDKPVALYETPYRLKKLLEELCALSVSVQKPSRNQKQIHVFVGIHLSTQKEQCWSVPIRELPALAKRIPKAPPVVILYKR